MQLGNLVTVTELSRLTGKTRPTIYKYMKDFEDGKYDDIPYTFLMLLELGRRAGATKAEVIAYCEKNFPKGKAEGASPLAREVADLILENEKSLDLERLRTMITKEIEKNAR